MHASGKDRPLDGCPCGRTIEPGRDERIEITAAAQGDALAIQVRIPAYQGADLNRDMGELMTRATVMMVTVGIGHIVFTAMEGIATCVLCRHVSAYG